MYLKTGLTIALGEYNKNFDGLEFEFIGDDSETPYKIGFCTKGHFQISYPSASFKEEINEGENIIFSPRYGSRFKMYPKEEITLLYIFISRDFLHNYFHIESCDLDSAIQKMCTSDFLFARGSNTSQMELALSEILQTKNPDPLNKIMLESKTLELLSLFFKQFRIGNNHLTDKEREIILDIHFSLLQQPDREISIRELTTKYPLNEHKLQRGFKTLFGNTVKKHFRKIRMEVAKKLITEKGLTVSEASYEVGYSNLSHFSQSFKNEFGILPSKAKEQNCRSWGKD